MWYNPLHGLDMIQKIFTEPLLFFVYVR